MKATSKKIINESQSNMKNTSKNTKKAMLKEKVGNVATEVKNTTKKVTTGTKDLVDVSKNKVMEVMDVNGDGTVDIEDVIIMGLRTPGVCIKRDEFLKKEFSKNYSKDIIQKAIETTPVNAGISIKEINLTADNVIKFERTCVTGISTALGAPGGFAMVATIPADIAQYYGYMLRAAQKLMYLYGFPEINVKEKGHTLDTETLNLLILCLGVMYGVAGANNAIKAIAKALSVGVEKKLVNASLTKGTVYPIVKNVAKWFGVTMNKKVFAGFFKDAIPVVGGVVGGGITFATFKPCCNKLKICLQDTMLSNINHIEIEEEKLI